MEGADQRRIKRPVLDPQPFQVRAAYCRRSGIKRAPDLVPARAGVAALERRAAARRRASLRVRRGAVKPQVLPSNVGSASVSFATSTTRRDLRVAALVASILLHQTAPTIGESAFLHYGVGVSFGLLFGVVVLVCSILCVMISSPAKRRSAVALSFLGYSAAVMRHARRVVWSLVTSYPRLIATYACVTMAFSVR